MPSQPYGAASLILLVSLGSTACTDHSTPVEPVSVATAEAANDPTSRSEREPATRFIELDVDGKIYRADTSSSFGIRFNGIYDNPRFSAQMSSTWAGAETMTILELSVLDFRPQVGSLTVGTGTDGAPALRLARLPDSDNPAWLSIGGQLNLEHIELNQDSTMIERLAGHFDAQFREAQTGAPALVDNGQERSIRGRFDFRMDHRPQW